MATYAQDEGYIFISNQEIHTTRAKGGRLDRLMQAAKGSRIIINHDNNTFELVGNDKVEITDEAWRRARDDDFAEF